MTKHKGSPEWFANDIFNHIKHITEANDFITRKVCNYMVKKLAEHADEPMDLYYREVLHYVNKVGGKT